MASILAKLINVRSQRATRIIEFLDAYLKALEKQSPFLAFRNITLSAVHIDQFVRPGAGSDEAPTDETEFAYLSQDNESAHTRRQSIALPGHVWGQQVDQAQARRARIVLLGEPGQGKTITTCDTAIKNLKRMLAVFESRSTPIESLVLPIWVRASALVRAATFDLATAIIEALEKDVIAKDLPGQVKHWLAQQLQLTQKGLIIVDSLDELRPDQLRKFSQYSEWLNEYAGGVILTCRTEDWEGRKKYVAAGKEYAPFRLALLKPEQREEFIRRFFQATGNDNPSELTQLLKDNEGLREACKTPLLLTFACLLQEVTALDDKTTYADLYDGMVQHLFSGEWRTKQPSWHGKAKLGHSLLKRLAQVVWQLVKENPGADRFSANEWDKAESACRNLAHWRELPEHFVDELEEVGLFIKAGVERNTLYSPCWSFLHRTVGEYLAALGCITSAGDPGQVCAELHPHKWFDPVWREFLKFAVNLLPNANELMKKLKPSRYPPGYRLYPSTHIVGYAREIDKRHLSDAAKLLQEDLEKWLDGDSSIQDNWLFDCFQVFFINKKAREQKRRFCGIILKRLGVNDTGARARAVRALGELQAKRTLSQLKNTLLEDADTRVKECAAIALSQLGYDLLNLERPNSQIRRAVIGALPRFKRDDRIIIGLLCDASEDKDPEIQQAAAASLGEYGGPDAVDKLSKLSTTPHPKEVTRRIAAALGETGSPQAIAPLIKILGNTKNEVFTHLQATKAIRQLHKKQAISTPQEKAELISGLKQAIEAQPNTELALNIAHTLVDLGETEYVGRMSQLKNPPGDRVWQVTELRARLGNEQAIGRLCNALINDPSAATKLRTLMVLARLDRPSENCDIFIAALANNNDPALTQRACLELENVAHALRKQASKASYGKLRQLIEALWNARERIPEAGNSFWRLLWSLPSDTRSEWRDKYFAL